MSLPSPADQFPIEIYEYILSFVAADQDDYSKFSIKSCALVSRSFLSLARNHIFGHIRSIKSFAQIILQTPEIAHHVHSLGHLGEDLIAIEGLLDALKMLTRLRCLIIAHPLAPGTLQNLEWSELPLPLQVELLHRPTLTQLELFRIRNLDLSDLTMCSSLESLGMEDVTLSPIAVHRQTKTLQLKDYYTFLDKNDITDQLSTACSVNGTRIIDFSALQTLKLSTERDITKGPQEWLFKSCTQLTRIVVEVDKGKRASNPLLLQGFADMILPSLRTLRYLKFSFFGTDGGDYGLAAELEAIPKENIIENIHINVLASLADYYEEAWGNEWVALDKALTRDPSKWINLKTVVIKFDVDWDFDPPEDPNIEEIMRFLPKDQLMGLLGNKVIDFYYEFDGLPREYTKQYWESVS